MVQFRLAVEAIPGEDICGCARDAIRLANQLAVCVRFSFNAVECLAYPGDDPKTTRDLDLADPDDKTPPRAV